MRACSWNVTDSKKSNFDLIIWGQPLDMTVQKNVPRFCTGSISGWNFQSLGQLVAHFIHWFTRRKVAVICECWSVWLCDTSRCTAKLTSLLGWPPLPRHGADYNQYKTLNLWRHNAGMVRCAVTGWRCLFDLFAHPSTEGSIVHGL